jgi:hypothetical protein
MGDTTDQDVPAMDDSRHLIHEIKNQLYIINMGLEVLRGARQNDEEFAKVVASIRRDGIEPLKLTAAALMELAARQQSGGAARREQSKDVADRK